MSHVNPATAPRWEKGDTSRIPFQVYTDPAIYQRELERIFYGRHWSYVGLDCEVPNPGDFKRTQIGERSVLMVRTKSGDVQVLENVCAHRGVQFIRERAGNRKLFVCPYHQWSYDLEGKLLGVPFRRGVPQDGVLQGGMPADFDMAEHSLNRLRVARRNGVVFATFDADTEDFEAYVGPTILNYFDRVFDGRELTLLGYSRQRIPGNWKLMQENIKDPYHPGLLHTWFVTFGLWRADNKSELKMDEHFRHAAMISTRGNAGAVNDITKGVSSFRDKMKLNDDRFLDVVHEPWWGEPTAVMTTLFPSVIIQQQVNSVSTRQIIPVDTGVFDFVWTHFGFADDSPEMHRRRLRQANLFGPAGFVSADDGEVIELSQRGFEQKPWHRAVVELGGRGCENTDHMVTETLIRGMYDYWRKVME